MHPRLIDGILITAYIAMHGWMLLVVVVLGVVADLALPEMSYSSFATAIALYAVSARWPLGRVWGWYVIVAGVPVATGLLWHGLTDEWGSMVDGLDLFGVLAIMLGATTRARLERREAWTALMRERLESAAAGERARIAAEMHDVVSHSLSVMIALANGAATGWEQHPARAREALRHLSDVGATAIRDTRRILDVLSDGDDQTSRCSVNLPESLDDLIETFRTAGLPVALFCTGSLDTLDDALSLTVYRIVQESLTNTLRHAKEPSQVEVVLDRDADRMVITTSDDGQTVHHPRLGGHGLVNIEQRAAARPRRVGGWCTRVWLPIEPQDPDR